MSAFGYTSEQLNALITIILAFVVVIGGAIGLLVWYVDATSIHHAEQCLVGCLQSAHALSVH